MKKTSTSWGNVADWYDELLEEGEGTFQKEVILPHLLRLLDIKKGQKILDLGCGQGFFARAFAALGAKVTGVDIAAPLISKAKEHSGGIEYLAASADKIPMISAKAMDTVVVVLAIQNMENIAGVLAECARILKPGGQLMFVLNHPTFRVPQASAWEWDAKKNVQYRRIDKYLSEAKVKIDMHPGDQTGEHTVSFHRPLQVYIKHLHKAGFAVTKMEEWISHRQGPKGKTFDALEQSRKEIPLFLFLEAKQLV